MQLPDDFKEFIALMIANCVQFVMIGGYAYNLYRNPRATGDIDFFVELSAENETRMRAVLLQFGFGDAIPPIEAPLLVDGKIIILGRSPFRIALLTSIAGVTFAEVEASSQTFELGGIEVKVISAATLLKNKQAAGRPKDLADVIEQKNLLGLV